MKAFIKGLSTINDESEIQEILQSILNLLDMQETYEIQKENYMSVYKSYGDLGGIQAMEDCQLKYSAEDEIVEIATLINNRVCEYLYSKDDPEKIDIQKEENKENE
jgi:hypothetical protein